MKTFIYYLNVPQWFNILFFLTLKHCWIVLLLSHFPIINNTSTCCVYNTLMLWFISWISEYELNNNIFPSFFFCLFQKNFDCIWHIRFVGYQQILTFHEQCLESGDNSDKIRLNTEIKRMKIMTEEQSKITKSISESMSSER